MLSFPFLFLLGASVFCTSFISGILGMAGGMILMGVLVSTVSVPSAMIIHAIAQFFANISRTIFHRKKVHARSLIYFIAALIPTMAVFSLFSFVPDKKTVLLLMGLAPFGGFLLRNKLHFNFTRPAHAMFCGFVITCFQLLAGTAGPWLDIFFQNLKITRHEVIATKSAAMTISHFSKFIYFWFIVANVSADVNEIEPWFWPLIAILSVTGTHLSRFVLDRMTDQHFYKATQATLLAIGVFYLYQSFQLWMHTS